MNYLDKTDLPVIGLLDICLIAFRLFSDMII